MADEKKLLERTLPGMNREARFAQVEHAENVRDTLKCILAYFAREKSMVLIMLFIVILGTLCGVYAPSLQSWSISASGILPCGRLSQLLWIPHRKP